MGQNIFKIYGFQVMIIIADILCFLFSGGRSNRNEIVLKSILELQKKIKEFQSADDNANVTTSVE